MVSLAKLNRGMVFIPSCLGYGFPSRLREILVDLKLSNPGIDSEKWKVYVSRSYDHGQPVLQDRDFKAFFAIVTVNKREEPVIETPL